MARDYFCCYHSYLKKTQRLSDQEVGRLFRALMEYSATGETQELTGRESMAFDFIADDIDRAKESYASKCETNSENGAKGGRAKKANAIEKSERYQTLPNVSECSHNEDKDEDDNENKDDSNSVPRKRATRTKFVKPSVDDVAAYCAERKNGIDPQHFVDYYDRNGWVVGKTPMKDWKATVRTWEKNEFNNKQIKPSTPASYDIERAEQRAKTSVPVLKKNERR